MEAKIALAKNIALKELGGGVSRKVLAYHEKLMIVEVRFAQGAVGSIHTHPHLQSTYVKCGKFRFTIDGDTVEVGEGDSIAFPENLPHGTLCMEAGVLIDIFTPMREDFV
ncbi:MAG: cupin domain-containing protein [Clostridia bacterium]